MSGRDAFANDVLERLAQSNHRYQREHGHYIVPLAERLLRSRRTLALAHRMAVAGVGPDTTPEQCLAAIASFLEKRGSGQWEPPAERDEPPEGYVIPEGDERCDFTMDACICMKRKSHDGLHACAHGGWRSPRHGFWWADSAYLAPGLHFRRRRVVAWPFSVWWRYRRISWWWPL